MKKNKSTIKRRNILIIILIISILIVIVKLNNEPNNKNKEISVIISNQDITSELENKIFVQNDVVYMSFDDIKKCLDETIYFEEEDDLIITSSDRKIAALKIDESDIEINGSEISIDGQALKMMENIIYLPISELENVYDYELNYIPESKNVIIDYYSNRIEKAKVKKKSSLKKEEKKFSAAIEKLKKDDEVFVISKDNKWTKIRTQKGNIGYIKNSKLKDFSVERDNFNISKNDDSAKCLEKNISSENISSYQERKKLANELLLEAVSKQYKNVKIVFDKDTDNNDYKRFMIEVTPVLKECGIDAIFNNI